MMINITHEYLVRKHKKINVKILKERKKIEQELIRGKYYSFILVSVILLQFIELLMITYSHFKKKILYKEKLEELILKEELNFNPVSKTFDINEKTILLLLKKLEKFEKDKKYLKEKITLSKLSTDFDSNTKYLSKIISLYRNKGFVRYINDLKVDYLISLLHENKKTRNYTNKAMAEEVGFSTTERFVNAFFSKTGMSTSCFIKKIQKTDIAHSFSQ
jgi:AraC-like DNA-binding protein